MTIGQIGLIISTVVGIGITAGVLGKCGYNNNKYGKFALCISDKTKKRYDEINNFLKGMKQLALKDKDTQDLKEQMGISDDKIDELIHDTTIFLTKTSENFEGLASIENLDRLLRYVEKNKTKIEELKKSFDSIVDKEKSGNKMKFEDVIKLFNFIKGKLD